MFTEGILSTHWRNRLFNTLLSPKLPFLFEEANKTNKTIISCIVDLSTETIGKKEETKEEIKEIKAPSEPKLSDITGGVIFRLDTEESIVPLLIKYNGVEMYKSIRGREGFFPVGLFVITPIKENFSDSISTHSELNSAFWSIPSGDFLSKEIILGKSLKEEEYHRWFRKEMRYASFKLSVTEEELKSLPFLPDGNVYVIFKSHLANYIKTKERLPLLSQCKIYSRKDIMKILSSNLLSLNEQKEIILAMNANKDKTLLMFILVNYHRYYPCLIDNEYKILV